MIERLLIGVGLVAALVYGAYLYGVDTTRDHYINLQLQEEVRVVVKQKAGVIKTITKYIKAKEKHDANLPVVTRDIVARCLGVLPDGAALRPGRAGAGVPGDGEGALGPDAAAPDEADRAWCQDLADDYAAGVHNWDALRLALGWIEASGGAPKSR